MRNYQFYKIKKERKEYLGERYFQVSFDSDTVLQVCINPSMEMRRGRTNNIGIYLISRLTFVSNYYGMNYVEPCTAKEFNMRYDAMVKMLRLGSDQ